MAMTPDSVAVATSEWQQRDADDHLGLRFMLWTVSALWLVFVGLWLVVFTRMLADASTVLAMFEAENGGPLSADEWLNHREAREIFCPHPNGDPSTNRIGRYINGSLAYGPALAIGGMLTFGTGLLLSMSNVAFGTSEHRWMGQAIIALFFVSFVPIAIYSGEIGALTQITE